MSTSQESVQVDFTSAQEAAQTYYGDGSGGGESGDDGSDTPGSAQWGELQTEPTDWQAGWTLAYQPHTNEDGRRRWFVFRVNQSEEFEALRMSGQADVYPEDANLEELPHTEQEQEARDAYAAWLDENGGDQQEQQEGGENWTEWTQLNQVAGWTVWGRESQSSDAVQFLAAGELQDGGVRYLQADGTAGEETHIFESQDALQEALNAWQSSVENGDVPEDQQPTGSSPGRGRVTEDAANAGANGSGMGPLGGAVSAVGGPINAVLVVVMVLVAAYYLDKRGYVDIGLNERVDGIIQEMGQ